MSMTAEHGTVGRWHDSGMQRSLAQVSVDTDYVTGPSSARLTKAYLSPVNKCAAWPD